jgi:K+-transporting ATPase KdpF subunit
MTYELIFGAITAVGLLIYLGYVLLHPERF